MKKVGGWRLEVGGWRVNHFFFIFLLSSSLYPLTSIYATSPELPEPKPLNFIPPKAKRFTLSNGITVHFLEDHDLPQIQIAAYIPGGSIYDPASKTGLSGLFASVLPYGGTKELDPDQVTKELELMGSSVGAGAGEEEFSASLFSLSKNFDRTLELFSKLIREPRLDAAKLEVEKKMVLGAIARRNDEPRDISRREFKRMLYGADSPWGRRIEIKTIEKISRKDLFQLHTDRFRPAKMILAVSGDIPEAALIEKLELHLGSKVWAGAASALPALAPIKPITQRAVYYVHKESAQQSAVRLGHFGVKRHDPDHFALEVMNEILGGGFASRLFRNVRSRKGLAYSVGSGLTEPADYGMIMAGVGSKAETTSQALEEVLREITAMREAPPTAEELNIAKNQLINSFIQNFRTSHQIATMAASLHYHSYPDDWLETYQARLAAVTAENVLRAAKTYLKPETAIILVVGNDKNFDKPLSLFGTVKLLNPEDGSVKENNRQPSQSE